MLDVHETFYSLMLMLWACRRRRLRARFSLPTQTSPGLTRVELPNVQQIKHRGEACMELCQAEEARRKAQIQQCPGSHSFLLPQTYSRQVLERCLSAFHKQPQHLWEDVRLHIV